MAYSVSLKVETTIQHVSPAYDLWMAYLLCREGHGAYYVKERLSSWRAHAGNLTSQGGSDWALGTAECSRTIANDARLESVRPIAKRKAAQAFFGLAVNSWTAGRRSDCWTNAWRSLWLEPSWKGLVATCLPILPRHLAPLLTKRPVRK